MKRLAIALFSLMLGSGARAQILPDAPVTTSDRTASSLAPSTSPIIVPKDTKLILVALDTVSSASAKRGDTVRFAVTKDLAQSGGIVIPAGTTVTGTIVKAKHGSPNHRVGYLRIHLRRLDLGDGIEVPLTLSDPSYTLKGGRGTHVRARDVLDDVGGAAVCVALLPLCIALEVAISDNGKPDGKDAVLPKCFPVEVWTRSSAELKPSDARFGGGASGKEPNWMPQSCIDGFKIDWTVSNAEMLVIE
ncbi:MAG: hypothetical protein JST28_04340 [Acidobacteria bacterium]|nr:hypothetical protein [Acidobacteriota bacterium]